MTLSGFHPCQIFSTDTAGIPSLIAWTFSEKYIISKSLMSLQEDILEGYMYQQYIQRLESAKPHLKFRNSFCISVVVLSK